VVEAKGTVLWITQPVRKFRTKYGNRNSAELREGMEKLLQLRVEAGLRTMSSIETIE
jgi:hypothetical protein